jgi:hypothetical protein
MRKPDISRNNSTSLQPKEVGMKSRIYGRVVFRHSPGLCQEKKNQLAVISINSKDGNTPQDINLANFCFITHT